MTDFCKKYAAEINSEGKDGGGSAVSGGGCIWSVLYDQMKSSCQSDCFHRTFACLTPESYCVRAGNEKGALSAGMQFLGDTAGFVDISQVKTFDNASDCDTFCLAAKDTGIRVMTSPPPPGSPPPAPSPGPPLSPPSASHQPTPSKLTAFRSYDNHQHEESKKKKCNSQCVSRIADGTTKGFVHLGPAGGPETIPCCAWASATIDLDPMGADVDDNILDSLAQRRGVEHRAVHFL